MIAGQMIGKDLCAALGLPPMTRGFTLRRYTGEPVTVECEFYPSGSFQTAALAQYYLVPRADEPAQPLHFDAWMRDRTERAHRTYMERISQRLPCDWTTEDIARYFGAPLS